MCVCVCVCVLVEGWGGENRGEGGFLGSLLCSCTRVQIQGGSVQALYSAPRKEQVLNTAAPGYRKHTALGLGTPEV